MRRIFILIMVLFFSCDFFKGIRNDTQKQIISHKRFFNEISLNGIVLNKEYCNYCDINKFQVEILLNDFDISKVKLENQSYMPFYKLTSNQRLILSVNKVFYEQAEKSDKFIKKPNTLIVLLNSKPFKIFNDNDFNWTLCNDTE